MDSEKSMLLISYSKELVDGKPLYVSSNCLPVKVKFEPAGHSFHAAALRLAGNYLEVDTEEEEDDEKEVPSAKESAYVPSSDSYSSKGKKKSGGEAKQQDHYALLGLSHLRYLATEDQIRKSYRETALRHHPDKQAALLLAEETEDAKQTKKDEIENHFKAIQEAYEVLMDPVRRRIYDSTDEFDDEIPCDCSPQDFFKVYGPAFLRNGRWSTNQPIPTLGDDNTPLDEVDRFYDSWYSFKSWREFPHDEEFDLEQAESREHRRWMEKQNAKLTEKARKEEYARIRTLVDNAYRRDPRILRRKEEQKAEKQRKKEAKVLAKKKQEEEAARIIEGERLRKLEEDKKAAEAASNKKKLKEKEKKLLRKEKTRLRTLSTSVLSRHLLDLTDDDVEGLCSSLDKEQLAKLCDSMEGKDEMARAKLLRETLESDHKMKDEKEDEKNLQQNGSAVVNGEVPYIFHEKREKPWNKEEIELLRKGMQKYPKGTSRRWEVISEYIGTGRSVEEILKATKTVLLQKPDTNKAFDSFLEKRKPAKTIESPLSTRDDIPVLSNGNVAKGNVPVSENLPESSNESTNSLNSDKVPVTNGISSNSDQDLWSAAQEKALVQALKTFPKDTPQRYERVAAAVPGKTMAQCKKKITLMKESFRNNSVAEKNTSSPDNSQESSAHNESCKTSDDSNASNAIPSSSDEESWSEVQEKALIQALKSFPKDANQRWERVATAVPGKTMNQCKKKFASLKENFRNKKNAV